MQWLLLIKHYNNFDHLLNFSHQQFEVSRSAKNILVITISFCATNVQKLGFFRHLIANKSIITKHFVKIP